MNVALPKVRSIQVKVVALLMLVALFAVLSTAITIINYEKNNAKEKELHRIDSIAQILAPTLTAAVVFRDEFNANELLIPLMSDNTIIDATVFDESDSVFVSIGSVDQNIVQLPNAFIIVDKVLVHDNTYFGKLVIRVNDLSIKNHIEVYSLFIVFMAVITLGTSLVLAIIFGRYITKPILQLGRLATSVTETNNYGLRSQSTTNDEIGELTDCFNLMLENIELRDRNLELKVKQRTKELEVVNYKLKRQAYTDSLSGLPNRRFLNKELRRYESLYQEKQIMGFSILFLDLDGFKEVNDTMGHDHGDELLIAVSEKLRAVIRDRDLVARLGGDEFTILLGDVTDKSITKKVATNIHKALNEPFLINGEQVLVTVSIGIAIFPINGQNVETILKCADLALYEAKNDGRNCYQYFDTVMMQRLVEKRQIVNDLKIALQENQFELYFQPIIDIATGKMTNVEALIRWHHPIKGLIFPNDFISIAEEFGIIREIGEWVLRSASEHLSTLKQIYGRDIRISVNVSPDQFKGRFRWIDQWLLECKQRQLPVGLISFEITENLLMSSDDIVKQRLKQLKNVGIYIAIDDFGVGYSSLSYLQRIEIDIIKIDRSFVQNLVIDKNSQALCKAMINMANELGIKVVAEGIESKQQLELLGYYGCDFGQGYYFSKPVPIDILREREASLAST